MTLEDITKIRNDLDKLRKKKIEVQSDLRTLKKEKEELLSACKALGVDPKKINEELEQQEKNVKQAMERVTLKLEKLGGLD